MYNTFTLKQAAQYDHQTNAKGRLTGWGKICKDRQLRGVSRKARRIARRNANVGQE